EPVGGGDRAPLALAVDRDLRPRDRPGAVREARAQTAAGEREVVDERRSVVDEDGRRLERVLLHLLRRGRRLVARFDAHAVLALRERLRLPLVLALREDLVALRRVAPLVVALAPEGDAVAQRIVVRVVDAPGDLEHALVLRRLSSARGERRAR